MSEKQVINENDEQASTTTESGSAKSSGGKKSSSSGGAKKRSQQQKNRERPQGRVIEIVRDPNSTVKYVVVTRNDDTGERKSRKVTLREAMGESRRTGVRIRHGR